VALELIVQWPYETIQKTFLPLWVSIHFIRSIWRQLGELVPILADRHAALLQSEKLLLLQFYYPRWDVMSTESFLELLPGDGVSSDMCYGVGIPPIGCSAL
jgi:hypothetical protein